MTFKTGCQSLSGLTTNWSDIDPVGDQLFFYRSDGTAAVGHIANGQFVQTHTAEPRH